MFTLKDYQQEALEAVQKEYSQGTSTQLIALPTGTGKTVVMAVIAKAYDKKTLIIAHREELIEQTVNTLKAYWTDVDIGVCRAERNELNHQVVVGSVQTCSNPKRLEQLKAKEFDVLMIDEAHHAAATTYRKIVDGLGFERGTKKLLIGVTATPGRHDRKGLASVFSKVVFKRSITEMIEAGHLPKVFGRKIITSVSLRGVKTEKGDFVVSSLSNAINIPPRNALIVAKFLEHAHNRKAMVVTADVKHSQDLAATFNFKGIKAAAVWGKMPTLQRKHALADLKSGAIRVIISCGVLIEGFDEPSISCVLMARPTKSTQLYTQCVGRGLRPSEGKSDCLVIDFVDSHHKLETIISLGSAIPNAKIEQEPTEKSNERPSQAPTPAPLVPTAIRVDADVEFDILGTTSPRLPKEIRSHYVWANLGDSEWSLPADDNTEIIVSPLGTGFTAYYHFDGVASQLLNLPVSFENCVRRAESMASSHLKMSFGNHNNPWFAKAKQEQPTGFQIRQLQELGIDTLPTSKASACDSIRRGFALQRKKRRIKEAHRRSRFR